MLLVGLLFLFPVEMLDSIPNQLGLYSSIRVLHYPNIGLTDIPDFTVILRFDDPIINVLWLRLLLLYISKYLGRYYN